ncbi:twin-arginine translocation signal domain-containing protein [Natrialba aegyptia]|uniref:Uncharacterized protein n=1 Tax=Natrialba aegyptia DSM 13077 TaxID=1227491 RepID=M0B823_9EURY|nr:twin-arginine translocation signal domain-containing protein [Natrialba aegyptia]ELZ06657.1 hypothetical protein C480_08803 [Natrialba aegyptia DSM 13077]
MQRRTVLSMAGAAGGMLALSGCLSNGGLFGSNDRINKNGEIAITVDGESFETKSQFQSENVDNESAAFHLHESNGRWYMEGEEPVTVAEGIDLLPSFEFEMASGTPVMTIDGTEYDASEPGTEISFRLDGEEIDPTEHEPVDGEEISVEITTESETETADDDAADETNAADETGAANETESTSDGEN